MPSPLQRALSIANLKECCLKSPIPESTWSALRTGPGRTSTPPPPLPPKAAQGLGRVQESEEDHDSLSDLAGVTDDRSKPGPHSSLSGIVPYKIPSSTSTNSISKPGSVAFVPVKPVPIRFKYNDKVESARQILEAHRKQWARERGLEEPLSLGMFRMWYLESGRPGQTERGEGGMKHVGEPGIDSGSEGEKEKIEPVAEKKEIKTEKVMEESKWSVKKKKGHGKKSKTRN